MLFLPLAYASLVDLLSRPKPIDLEWWQRNAEEATVLGAKLEENRGIHLWLQLPDVAEPRAYVLPWDRETAERLQEAQREAAAAGRRCAHADALRAQPRRSRAACSTPSPSRRLPPKDYAEPQPRFYQPPGRDA